jgi:hypothetical protein
MAREKRAPGQAALVIATVPKKDLSSRAVQPREEFLALINREQR